MLADLDHDRAASVAEPIGARVTADPHQLITDSEVEAVLIASHDATHPEFIRACVAAGKPVLCEKPLAPTLEESAALLVEIGSQAALVSLGFMRRFDPGYVALKAAIMDRTMGVPVLVHSTGRGVTRRTLPGDDPRRWTHVRLNIFPDGGVARFRVHGEVVVDPRFADQHRRPAGPGERRPAAGHVRRVLLLAGEPDPDPPGAADG